MKKIYGWALAGLLLAGCGTAAETDTADTDDRTKDHAAFAEEYTELSEDNVFYYGDQEQILAMLQHGTGVVYLGFDECPWCQRYVVYLNEVCEKAGLEVMYYDILEDRSDNTEFYQQVVEILGDNLDFDSDGFPRIYAPDVSFVISGEIIGHDNETSMLSTDEISVEDYWTDEKISAIKEKLSAWAEKTASAKAAKDAEGCDEGCKVE